MDRTQEQPRKQMLLWSIIIAALIAVIFFCCWHLRQSRLAQQLAMKPSYGFSIPSGHARKKTYVFDSNGNMIDIEAMPYATAL